MTRIALFQSTTGIDPAANARNLADAVDQASAGGAEMLFTPEMTGLLDRDSARAAKVIREQEEEQVLQLEAALVLACGGDEVADRRKHDRGRLSPRQEVQRDGNARGDQPDQGPGMEQADHDDRARGARASRSTTP